MKKDYILAPDFPIEPIEGTQRIILDLASGIRKPQNNKEKRLLKQIKEIAKKGYILDLPFD